MAIGRTRGHASVAYQFLLGVATMDCWLDLCIIPVPHAEEQSQKNPSRSLLGFLEK